MRRIFCATIGITTTCAGSNSRLISNKRIWEREMSQADERFGAIDEHASQERVSGQSALPQAGIFYVIDAAIYLEGTPVLEAEDDGEFKTHPNGHVEYWPLLAKRLNIVRPLSYDYYPRGRMNYAKTEESYRFYLD
jgi:hypothetical protein